MTKEVQQSDSDVRLDETGHVEVCCGLIDGVGVLTASFYPLCDDAVQAEVCNGFKEIRVRPDTYTKRTVTEAYEL